MPPASRSSEHRSPPSCRETGRSTRRWGTHGHFGAKLHRSRNGGETWEEIAAPRWPEKPADADDRNPMSGAPWPWSPDQIWILEPDPRGP